MEDIRPALYHLRAAQNRNRTTTAQKAPQEPRSGHGVGRFLCSILWLCCIEWSAQCWSFVIVCRWCLLQVICDRDDYALALFQRRWETPCMRAESGSEVSMSISVSMLATRNKYLRRASNPQSPRKERGARLRRAAPYPLGHTSSCARSCSTPNHALHRLVDMTLRMSLDACMCVYAK